MAERRRWLDDSIREYGVRDLFDNSLSMFRENWRNSGEGLGVSGMSVRLRDRTESGRASWRAYARVDPYSDGTIRTTFYPRAISLCSPEFRPGIEPEDIRQSLKYAADLTDKHVPKFPQDKSWITEAANKVAAEVDTSLDPAIAAMQRASLPKEDWSEVYRDWSQGRH